MNIWFWILVILGALSLGINIGKHGQERRYSGWSSLISFVLEVFIIILTIKHGGF